jgi:protein-tyrosine kinase
MNQNSSNMQMSSDNDRSIGDIISQTKGLTIDQMQAILDYQRSHSVKFGEAAVELGFVKPSDVMWALSQQFHYPYSQSSTLNISPELVMANNPFSEAAKQFRDTRTKLLQGVLDPQNARVAIAIASADIGDGKSFFAANLSIALSQLGRRTLLVDANLRSPRQHAIFNIDNKGGLSSILSGRSGGNVVRPIDELPELYVLPVGVTPPNPIELLQHISFRQLMLDLLSKFEYVLVDTPADAHGSDGRVIASVCGAALLVTRKNNTNMAGVKAMLDDMKKAGTYVAGAVMNDY